MSNTSLDESVENKSYNNLDDLFEDSYSGDYTYTGDNIRFIKNEAQDYDLEKEPKTDLSKLVVPHVEQIPKIISYDYIKLKFDLLRADEAKLTFNRKAFMRSRKPKTPASESQTYASLIVNAEGSMTMTMELTPDEEAYNDVSMEYTYRKTKYPNAKPFYSRGRKRMGLLHMYVLDGELVIMISGKIVSGTGDLGLLSSDTIHAALDMVKSTKLIDFDNEAFIDIAEVLSVHVTNDLDVGWVNEYIKAFSSYLPMRTDKYNILKYKTGYIILQTGKTNKNRPHYEFCIYNKGSELNSKDNFLYKTRIGKEGVQIADKTLRLELRLFNFKAIRNFLVPEKRTGTITLRELLDCKRKPIIEMLKLLEITNKGLEEARGKYITMYEDETFPTQAEFERMQGLIYMLEKNNYNLDSVRSYIEVETHKKTHSTYFQTRRATLQQYITCYKPRTVALLRELLAGMSY